MIELKSDKVSLRELQKSDSKRIALLANDQSISEMTMDIPYPYTLKDAEKFLEHCIAEYDRKNEYIFGIIERSSGMLTGCIGMSNVKIHKHGEMGYWMGRAYWGKGYTTEAVSLMVKFAFEDLKLNKVFAHFMPKNPASGKVLEKNGMVKEGVLRKHIIKNGEFTDMVFMSILKEEYEQRKR